jgi:hypothetical protein
MRQEIGNHYRPCSGSDFLKMVQKQHGDTREGATVLGYHLDNRRWELEPWNVKSK